MKRQESSTIFTNCELQYLTFQYFRGKLSDILQPLGKKKRKDIYSHILDTACRARSFNPKRFGDHIAHQPHVDFIWYPSTSFFLSLFSRADIWQHRLLLQRLFVDLFCRFCLPVSPAQQRQSDQQVPLFELKLFTKRLVIALGPGLKHAPRWTDTFQLAVREAQLREAFFNFISPPCCINHLQQTGQRGDVPPPHIHDS